MADTTDVKLIVGYVDGHTFQVPCNRAEGEKAVGDIAKIQGKAGTVNLGNVATIQTYGIRYAYLEPEPTAISG